MLAPDSEFDILAQQCARRFAENPRLYLIEDWGGSVAVLRFYGDESFGGKRGGFQGCYAVAGYLAPATAWKRITGHWAAVLDLHPKIEFFHMAECFAAMDGYQSQGILGQFAGFSKKEAEDKLRALISVLEEHAGELGCAHSIITWDTFQHALTKEDRGLLLSPFTLCFAGVVDMCRQILRGTDVESPIAFTFDERADVAEHLHHAWNATKTGWPEDAVIMGALSFADDKRCIPLQCADLLAWHVRRHFIQPVQDHGRPREEYVRLKSAVSKWYGHTWNEEDLRARREAKWLSLRNYAQARKRLQGAPKLRPAKDKSQYPENRN